MDWLKQPEIQRIGRLFVAGKVVAYPTEAVWGLGCDPQNAAAVDALLDLKQRPVSKGLIVVAASIAQLAPYLSQVTPAQSRQLHATWPGPITWLVPDNGYAPAWIRGQHSSVALRVSSHPVVAALCQAFGAPIVSTSANRAGMPAARDTAAVQREFGDALAGIAPGEVGQATNPTAIRDLLTGDILRQG